MELGRAASNCRSSGNSSDHQTIAFPKQNPSDDSRGIAISDRTADHALCLAWGTKLHDSSWAWMLTAIYMTRNRSLPLARNLRWKMGKCPSSSTFASLTGSKAGYADVTQPRKVYKPTAADSSDGKWANARRHRVPPIKDPHKSKSSSISFASPSKPSVTAYDAYQLKRQFDQHSGLLPGGSR